MALADSLRKAASKAIKRLGADVTLRYVRASSYNTTDGTITERPADVDVKGVVSDVTAREVNELVQAGDKKVLVAAASFSEAPTTADRVLISRKLYQVISVQTVEQDNKAITHELILRG